MEETASKLQHESVPPPLVAARITVFAMQLRYKRKSQGLKVHLARVETAFFMSLELGGNMSAIVLMLPSGVLYLQNFVIIPPPLFFPIEMPSVIPWKLSVNFIPVNI